MTRITTPVSGFNGKVAGVQFVDGVGETDNEAALDYFRRQGYGGVDENEDEVGGEPSEDELQNELLGTVYTDPDTGAGRDASDPRNDLIPVGGVKSDGLIVAGPGKGKRVSPKRASESTSGTTDTQPTAPGQPVQELGDPEQHSSTPAGTNPVEATADQQAPEQPIPTGESTPADTGSESASKSKGA